MSSITTIRDKSGRAIKYRARYRTPEGESRSLTFTKRIDAENHLASTEHRKLTGEFVDSTASRMTFGEYASGWLDRKRANLKATTVQTFSAHLNKHILPTFADRPLGSITREQVKSFAAGLQPGVAATTARAIVFTLAAVLREAVEDRRIFHNVAERIQVGAATDRRVDPMHIAQVSSLVPALADAMPRRWRAAVLLMASTGLRLGECLGLSVDRVDFLRRTIRIDRQLTNVAGQTGWGSTKTRAGVRVIPVPQHVIDLLAAHLAEFPAKSGALIFTMDNGRPVTRSRWSSHYRDACAAVELVGRTRTHDLRHVAASALIAGGLSVAAVQAVLGHASPAETLEVYTHLWPTDEDKTRAAIERASASWLTSAASAASTR